MNSSNTIVKMLRHPYYLFNLKLVQTTQNCILPNTIHDNEHKNIVICNDTLAKKKKKKEEEEKKD